MDEKMPINPMDLTDRRILVTGASSGIGRATALLLSKLGAKVLLLARNEERLQATLNSLEGDDHGQYIFDLNATDEIPAMMKSIAMEHGQLSGLFHSAGNYLTLPVTIMKKKYIDRIFSSSIVAALMLARGFCQKAVRIPGPASMVFMSSIAGLRGVAGTSIYAGSKGAVDAAMRALAVELAPKGIRVNAIAAGGVESGIHAEIAKNLSEAEFSQYERKHLMGFGTSEDVAYAAAFLFSDAARWITGTTMIVDGGYHCA
jgi:NAD(P)-dependent dehydrogenase (short-subunit alcohol dehydrogenase family)